MDKYIYDENNGLWYELQGDYYLPCLTLPPEEENPIGIWGQRHKHFLKEYRKATYTTLLTSGKLNTYLAEIDRQAQERFKRAHRANETGTGYHGTAKGGKRLKMGRENE